MGPDFSPKMTVKSLTSQQLVRIHQLFRQAKFDDPSGNVCIPYLLYFSAILWLLSYVQLVIVVSKSTNSIVS